jgi:predicted nucleic acid-binding protein
LTLYVLDTSAILAVLYEESGAERVMALLGPPAAEMELHEPTDAADDVELPLLPFMALMELEYLTRRRVGAGEAYRALQLVQAWPVVLAESDAAWRHEAARVKASTSLSVADAWIGALALLHEAVLVHKDPEYDALEGLLAERLPYG